MADSELSIEQIHSAQLETLKKFAEICEKEGFTYFLAFGTLLGAVRHENFIPWDDDVDVMMPRQDYEKLINYCIRNRSALSPFELHSIYTNDNYIYPIGRFSNSDYRLCCDNNVKEYGLGMFIDIYPMDGLGENVDEIKKRHKKMYKIIRFIDIGGRKKATGFSGNIVKRFLKKIVFYYIKVRGLKHYILKIEKEGKKIPYESCSKVGCCVWGTRVFDKKWVESTMMHKFADTEFRIPVGYDEILKEVYNDYMELPKESDRVPSHEYRAYKK